MSKDLAYSGLWAKGQPAAVSHGSLALQGEALLQKFQELLLRNISVVVATHSPTLAKTSTDLQVLAAHGGCLHAGLCCAAVWHQGIKPKTSRIAGLDGKVSPGPWRT